MLNEVKLCTSRLPTPYAAISPDTLDIGLLAAPFFLPFFPNFPGALLFIYWEDISSM